MTDKMPCSITDGPQSDDQPSDSPREPESDASDCRERWHSANELDLWSRNTVAVSAWRARMRAYAAGSPEPDCRSLSQHRRWRRLLNKFMEATL